MYFAIGSTIYIVCWDAHHGPDSYTTVLLCESLAGGSTPSVLATGLILLESLMVTLMSKVDCLDFTEASSPSLIKFTSPSCIAF